MLVAQHTLNERTLEVQVGTPKASSVPSLKEFFKIVLFVIWKPMSCCFILKIWCGCPICCVGHFQIGWINTVSLKLQLLPIAQAWRYRSVGFVNTWLLYLIIGVSFVNWWLIIEKEISKIVMVKQDAVELEAVMRKFNLKDSEHPLIPYLKTRQNEL